MEKLKEDQAAVIVVNRVFEDSTESWPNIKKELELIGQYSGGFKIVLTEDAASILLCFATLTLELITLRNLFRVDQANRLFQWTMEYLKSVDRTRDIHDEIHRFGEAFDYGINNCCYENPIHPLAVMMLAELRGETIQGFEDDYKEPGPLDRWCIRHDKLLVTSLSLALGSLVGRWKNLQEKYELEEVASQETTRTNQEFDQEIPNVESLASNHETEQRDIVRCATCGRNNRLNPAQSLQLPRCGNCHSVLIPTQEDILENVENLISNDNFVAAQQLLEAFVATIPAEWKVSEVKDGWYCYAFWNTDEFREYSAYLETQPPPTAGFKGIYRRSPSYPWAFYRLAFLAIERGDLTEALVALDRGLALEPEHPQLLCEKGLVLRQLKRLDESLSCYQHALVGRPWISPVEKAAALRGEAVTLIDLGELDTAETALRAALVLEPDNAVAQNELIVIAELKKKGGQANRSFQTILVDPDRPASLENLGRPNFLEDPRCQEYLSAKLQGATEEQLEKLFLILFPPKPGSAPTSSSGTDPQSTDTYWTPNETAEMKPPRTETGQESNNLEQTVIAEIFQTVTDTPGEPREALDNMIQMLEIIEIAISARENEKAFEAVTVLLLQLMSGFGHDTKIFLKTYPAFEQLKDRILSERYEDALTLTHTLHSLLLSAKRML